MTLSEEIKEKLIGKGASVVGYADLSAIPEKSTKGYKYGIIIGIALNTEIISGINNGPTIEYYNEYTQKNSLLDNLSEYAKEFLISKGYKAIAKTRSSVKLDENYCSELPHKTIATRAGIGWIGKCALLVTEKYGSAIRLSSVLTNAELEAGIPINESRCGDCSICKDICPGKAVRGNNWDISKKREDYYDAFSCRRTARERTAKIGVQESLCALCMLKCPWTQKYLKNSGVLIHE